jgi:hypothetical protein
MLNVILAKLNGHASEAESLSAALLQLGRDRDETRAKIESLQKQRHAALLDDASDTDLDKIERQIDRATVRLEKLNISEAPLVEKLAGARDAARRRRWRELHDSYRTAAGEFLVSARAAAEKHTALISIVGQAQREGFADDVRKTIPATPNANGHPLLAPELLDIFERAILPPATPARRAAPAAPRSALPKAADSLQHSITSAGGVQIPPDLLRAKRRSPDTAPLKHDQVRVKVLRAGYSPADDQPQCHYGDIIRMLRESAEVVAAHGIVEIINEPVRRTAASTDKPNVGARES